MIKYLMPFIFCSLSSTAQAQDVARGESLYKTCIQCHGEKGEGNPAMKGPRIGSQHSWYIISSINMFKSGERKNPTMLPFIKNLNDQDIADLAAYVATLPGTTEVAAPPASEANQE